MRATSVMWVALGAIAIAANVAQYASARAKESTPAQRVALERMRNQCAAVYVAISGDADDLASGDPVRQRSAADRFGQNVSNHSVYDIILCADPLPDLSLRDACWIKPDYRCLADVARTAATRIELTQRGLR